MASRCIEESYPYLKVLAANKRDKELCCHLLQKKVVLRGLKELVHNILHQTFPLTQEDKTRLKKFREELLILASKNCGKRQSDLFTSQRGGQLLSTLLSVGLPILAQLLFSKKHDSNRR